MAALGENLAAVQRAAACALTLGQAEVVATEPFALLAAVPALAADVRAGFEEAHECRAAASFACAMRDFGEFR